MDKMMSMIHNDKIFMTGGAGFIGTKLCRLLADNNKIYIYDKLLRNSIKQTNLLEHENVKLIEGDVFNFPYLEQIIGEIKPDVIIHMAAVAGIDTVIKSPSTTMKVNMIGTCNVLEAIKPYVTGLKRFINFSTSEVFGDYAYKAEEFRSTNLAPVGEARWTYSVSKLAAEHLVHSYYKEFGLPAVNLRPFNIYGPGQVGEGAIHGFVNKAISNKEIQIHGDGDQIRSWCYIDDMVQGVMLCMVKKEAVGNVFNIGNPRGTTTINDLAEKIVRLADSKSEIVHIPKTYVDIELRMPSVEKAKELLGYMPKIDLNEGLKRTITWYRNQGSV